MNREVQYLISMKYVHIDVDLDVDDSPAYFHGSILINIIEERKSRYMCHVPCMCPPATGLSLSLSYASRLFFKSIFIVN